MEISQSTKFITILNQARTGLQLVCAWFFKIDPVWISGICLCVHVCECVCVCVCPHPRLLITSGVMWCDMDLMWLVKKIKKLNMCYLVTVAIIINERGLGIDAHHGN